MGRSPEMKLVIKRTFFELVEDSVDVGPLRQRSLTDSAVCLTPTSLDKADAEASKAALDDDSETVAQSGDGSALVNQSATEELKAFLGLDRPLFEETLTRQQWDQLPSPAVASNAKTSHRNVSEVCEIPEDQRTTVIIRNLPNNYTRSMRLQLIDEESFINRYDFVYLPIDFGSQAGLGYAFVNLLTPADAQAFWAHFEGFRRWRVPSEKVCALNWSQPIQGLTAHVERYRNSPVMHENVPDAWKPVLYYGGKRIVFPPPTKSIKAPKIRNRANAQIH